MRHFTDETLHQLLDDSLSEQEERELGIHAQQCSVCAARLREWETLFPQIRGVAPVVEPAPAMAEAAAGSTEQPHRILPQNVVILPDWTPPPEPPETVSRRPRLAWVAIVALALVAGWFLVRRQHQKDLETASLGEAPPPTRSVVLYPTHTDTAASALGMGLSDSAPSLLPDSTSLQGPDTTSTTAPPVDSTAGTPADPATVASTSPPHQSTDDDFRPAVTRDPPVEFPIKDPTRKGGVSAGVATGAAPTADSSAVAKPLPEAFTRVTLGEAISRLGGPVRLIGGMTPEAVEIASGSALPGAEPGRAVVRLIYNAPAGRIILDQQRLNRRGSQEPDITINTGPSGVSVAQWVDWKGYWISLASHTSQESLLAIANRIQESP